VLDDQRRRDQRHQDREDQDWQALVGSHAEIVPATGLANGL
jgi:hypothetical protein